MHETHPVAEMAEPQPEVQATGLQLHPAVKLLAQAAFIGMAAYRVKKGRELGEIVATQKPEERGLRGIVETFKGSITDYFDGDWTRRLGITSEVGAFADFLADQEFVKPVAKELKANGELSPEHYDIERVRTYAVNGLRFWALLNGRSKDAAVGSLGKRRAAKRMLDTAIATSSLSRNTALMEQSASISDALTITSGLGYFVNYWLAGRKAQKAQAEAETPAEAPAGQKPEEPSARNSFMRKLVADPVDTVVDFIDENLPFVEPDHLTIVGTLLVLDAARRAIKDPDHPLMAVIEFTIGSLIDILDGALARKKLERTGKDSGIRGVLIDTLLDRVQEVTSLLALWYIAEERDDRVAANNFLAGAMTATLPSVMRAKAETKGVLVAETSLGGRVPKAIETGAAYLFNKQEKMLALLGATILTNNLNTAADRREAIKKGSKSDHFRGRDDTEESKRVARIKEKALTGVGVGGAAVAAALFAGYKLKSSRR